MYIESISQPKRHKIKLKNPFLSGQQIECDGLPLRIVLTRDTIYMGCYDVDPGVFRQIITVYDKKFPAQEINEFEYQSGDHPC